MYTILEHSTQQYVLGASCEVHGKLRSLIKMVTLGILKYFRKIIYLLRESGCKSHRKYYVA